jgi:transglutaminase-like putative cysteine protease
MSQFFIDVEIVSCKLTTYQYQKMSQKPETIYLKSNDFIDSDHPKVVAFAHKHGQGQSDREKIVKLYYAIRDGWRYNPYQVSDDPSVYRASVMLSRSYERGGHCIDKANLLAACARALGIPSRLHFANVRNHIGTEKLEKELGTSVLVFHGYVELWLEGKWVAATPAFNRELCDMLGVAPLEFDGRQDSVFQEYSRDGKQFMEYLHDYGHFPEIPFQQMVGEWQKYYPGYIAKLKAQKGLKEGNSAA